MKKSRYRDKNYRTLTVDSETHKRLKLLATKKGQTMKGYLKELLSK